MRYVKAGASGANNGTSWTNAFREIQPAIDACAAGDEVWIAAGTYYADYSVATGTHTGSRDQRIVVKSDISLFGGFAGTETARVQRNPWARRTIISGDIGQPGVVTDNTRTLLATPTRDRGQGGFPSQTVLNLVVEGLIFAGGYADDPRELGSGIVGGSGGAVYMGDGTAQFRDCIFVGNYAIYGGAIAHQQAPAGAGLAITTSLFAANSSLYVGGAVLFQSFTGQFTVKNSTFVNNSTGGRGGAIGTNIGNTSIYYNNLFSGNSTPPNTKVVEAGNQSPTTGGNILQQELVPPGTNNLVANAPVLASTPSPGADGRWGTADDEYLAVPLQSGAARDFGLTAGLPVDPTDLDGDTNTTEATPFDLRRSPRVQNGRPDAGAFEVNDEATVAPSLTAPAAGALVSSMTVTFTLPEAAQPGSVKLRFDNGTTIRTLTLASSQETAGPHTFTFNPAAPQATPTAIAAGNPIPDGTYAVLLEYADTLGRSPAASAAQVGVIIDTLPPTITAAPLQTVEATSPAGAVVNYNISSTDLNPPLTSTFTPPNGSTLPVGVTPVSVSVTDAAGNRRSTSFDVRVIDSRAPTIAPVAAQRLTAGQNGRGIMPDLLSLIVSSDAVGVVARTQSPPAGTELGLGLHPLSFTVADAAGNSATADTSIIVEYERLALAVRAATARAGVAAPGAGEAGGVPAGTIIERVFTPALSDYRDLAARAVLRAGRKRLAAVYREDGTGVGAIVAWEGMPAPGVPGATFASFSDPLLAPDGSIAFSARIKGAGPADTGLWTTAFNGTLQLVLREGAPVPDMPAGVRVRTIGSVSLRNREIVALISMRGAANSKVDTALLRLTGPSSGVALLREGSWPTISGPFGSPLTRFSVLAPAPGSPGHGRWHGNGIIVVRASLANGNIAVLAIDSGNFVTPVLAANPPTPEPGPASLFVDFGLPATSTSGQWFAALADLDSFGGRADKGQLVRADRNAVSQLASPGDSAPGLANARFVRFFDPAVNSSGLVAALAFTQTAGRALANPPGLWTSGSSFLEPVAVPGGAAPDANGTPTTTQWDSVLSFALPDGLGGPLFIAEIKGLGVTKANSLGLWAVDSQGVLRRLLRTGGEVNVGGFARTLAGFNLLQSTAPGLAATRSYNATGSVALLASFLDGSEALLRIDIP